MHFLLHIPNRMTSSLSISNFYMINGTMTYSTLIPWFGNLYFLEIWRFSLKVLVSFSPPIVYEFFNYILFILSRREFGIWCANFSFWIWIVVFIRFWTSKVCFSFFSLIIIFLRYIFFVLDIRECHRIHIQHYSNKHHDTP